VVLMMSQVFWDMMSLLAAGVALVVVVVVVAALWKCFVYRRKNTKIASELF
jgi:heme/copper-type cytochrome/quinol oxidase subunit 2